ncbi:hypothetical protein [Adlercreutzia sp. ZJ154]|uniref:hypothetical protein n=1 Tax=Adlercreutzia sp. ZJ154 TaxID=2709790 RepID=UPI0013EBD75C|nr:hypothetical protein [Adlercreutzia sp. ZJ154]
MGRLAITNSARWAACMEDIMSDTPFSISAREKKGFAYLLSHHKLRVHNCNFIKGDDGFAAVVGTFIYKGSVGHTALEMLFNDSLKVDVETIRHNSYGSYCVAICHGETIKVFVDPLATYSMNYFRSNEEFIITNSYFQIARIVQAKLDRLVFAEYCFTWSIIDNKTPFKKVFKLEGNQCVEIDTSTGKVKISQLLDASVSHEVAPQTFEDVVYGIRREADAFAQVRRDAFKDKTVFITGGLDARLMLASYIGNGDVAHLAQWGGSDAVSNYNEPDDRISRQVSEVAKTDYRFFDIARDFEEIYCVDNNAFDFNTYGDYAYIYGGNKRFKEIFLHKLESDYVDFGYFGETITQWDDLDAAYHEGFSIEDFVDDIYMERYRQCEFDEFFTMLRNRVIEEFIDYAQRCGIDATNLTKSDCMRLYHRYRQRADTIVCNFVNQFCYYTPLLAQPQIVKIIDGVNYDVFSDARINLNLVEQWMPNLLQVEYYSHGLFCVFDSENLLLERRHPDLGNQRLRCIVKTIMRRILGEERTRAILDVRLCKKFGDAYLDTEKKNRHIVQFCREAIEDHWSYLPVTWKRGEKGTPSLLAYPAIQCLMVDYASGIEENDFQERKYDD